MKKGLILLHGALGSQSDFNHFVELLNEGFNVHTFNFYGHGGTTSVEEFSIQLFAQQLIQFIYLNELKDVIIFGYSMGGYVALLAALSEPEIKQVFTYGTKFDWTAETASSEIKKLNPDKIQKKVPHFARTLQKKHSPTPWQEVINKTANMMGKLGDNPVINYSLVKNITIPVVVILGSKDTLVTVEESRNIVSTLPNSTLEIFKNWEHTWDKIDIEYLSKYLLAHV